MEHMNNIKLKYRLGENVADCCASILVDAECLESDGAFNPKHLGCIIHIFEDTSDSRFRLWATHKYKEVMKFINKLCVCDKDVMRPDDIITYDYLVREAMVEYHNIVDSNEWEPIDNKKISKDEPLLMMASTVTIESPVNQTIDKVSNKSYHKGKYKNSGVGSSTKSVATCHKCGKKGAEDVL